MTHARAVLAIERQADFAIIPMFLPGARRGWWNSGQLVRTVIGAVLLSDNTFDPKGLIPGHSWSRNVADTIAAGRLRAYAVEHPDVRAEDGGIGVVALAFVSHNQSHVPVHESNPASQELELR